MILHITGFADGLFINHDVDFSSQDTVTIKAAEMLQMPVLTFSLCVLIVENKLQERQSYQAHINLVAQLFSFTTAHELRHASCMPWCVISLFYLIDRIFK